MADIEITGIIEEVFTEDEEDINSLEETNEIIEPEDDPTIPTEDTDTGEASDETAETVIDGDVVEPDEEDTINAEEENDLTEAEIIAEEQEVEPIISNTETLPTIGNIEAGDRVMIALIDGEPTVLGTVGSGDRQQTEINTISADVAELGTVVAGKASIGDLNAQTARIDDLETTKADVTELNAATGRITTLETENTNVKGRLSAAEGNITSLTTNKANVTDLNAATARIGTLETENTNVKCRLTAAEGNITNLNANKVNTTDLEANYITSNQIAANYAKVDATNINTATIQDAWVAALLVQTGLLAHSGTIYTLDAIQLNADRITAGTIDVQRLVVTVDGHKYLVQFDSQGRPQYQKLDGDVIEDLTITADKIVAGAVTAEKITTENIVGTGGWINLRNGTFNYTNATSGEGISWDGTHLNIKAQQINIGTTNVLTTINSAVSTANSAASDAASAVSTANTAANNAASAVSTANTASSNASTAVSTANAAKQAATESATSAKAYAEAAASSASDASDSASAASSSATAASDSATAASDSASAASTSESNAASSASTASTKASQASTSATNAASSASAAAGSATTASQKATAAASSASAAATSESNAASSASTASTKASQASTSATNAASSATAAATSESNAAQSASDASDSADAASTSASTASTKAGEAATSATTASTKAGEAASSASTASTKATQASTSATNAATSASNASDSADRAEEAATGAEDSAATAVTTANEAKGLATTANTNASTANTNAATALSAVQEVQTLIRQYEDGVLVCKNGQQVGSLVNADGSFDVVSIDWSSGVPAASETLAQFGADGARIGNLNSARTEILETETSFYGNGGAQVGRISYTGQQSESFTQKCSYVHTLLNESSTVPADIYRGTFTYEPLSDIVVNGYYNGAYISPVTIDYTQDYAGTVNGIYYEYNATNKTIALSALNTATTEKTTYVGLSSSGYENNYIKVTPSVTATSSTPVVITLKNTIPNGNTFKIYSFWDLDYSTPMTFTVGTSATKTVSMKSLMGTVSAKGVYNATKKTITITPTSSSSTVDLGSLTYYANIASWKEFTLTYDRYYASPQYSFGINNNNNDAALSMLIGEGLVADNSHELVVGKYNSPELLGKFVVANGSDNDNRNNVFTVSYSGDVLAKGNISTNGYIMTPKDKGIYLSTDSSGSRIYAYDNGTSSLNNIMYKAYGDNAYHAFYAQGVNSLYIQPTRINATVPYYCDGKSLFSVKTISKDNISIAASSATQDTFSIAVSGYRPIAIAGFDLDNASSSGANVSRTIPIAIKVSGNSCLYQLANQSTSAAKVKLNVTVLYVPDTQTCPTLS